MTDFPGSLRPGVFPHFIGFLLFLTGAMLAFGLPSFAAGVIPEGTQVFDFRLEPHDTLRVWTIHFDLPEKDVMTGVFLVGREVTTSDALEIVRESLDRTSYSITLRLKRGYMAYGNGRLYLEFFKGTPAPTEPLSPPGLPQLSAHPRSFSLGMDHQGSHVAVTVFKRALGEPVWERVFDEHCLWEIPHDSLVVGGHYLLMASQCGREARYSPPALLGFTVEATQEPCSICQGSGWLGDPPSHSPKDGKSLNGGRPGTETGLPIRPRPTGKNYSEICPYCRGTGVRLYPFPVIEPATPNLPD